MDRILYDYALRMVGQPYRWGGDDTIDGFDCSGLVVELLQSCGELVHGFDTTAQGLFNHYDKHGSYLSASRFGALIFFGRSVTKISHIGFGLDQYRMIHAGGGGSATTTREEAARRNAYVMIRPIDYRKDRVAIVRPRYNCIGKT